MPLFPRRIDMPGLNQPRNQGLTHIRGINPPSLPPRRHPRRPRLHAMLHPPRIRIPQRRQQSKPLSAQQDITRISSTRRVQVADDHMPLGTPRPSQLNHPIPVRSLERWQGIVGDVHARHPDLRLGYPQVHLPSRKGRRRRFHLNPRPRRHQHAIGSPRTVRSHLLHQAMIGKHRTQLATAGRPELAENHDIRTLLHQRQQDLGNSSGAAPVQDVPEQQTHAVPLRYGSPVPPVPPITHSLTPIDSPDDPRLADYRHLTDADLRAAQLNGQAPFFIAESEGVVRHLLASPFPIRSILATHHHATVKMADVLGELDPAVPIYTAPDAIIESITGFTFHRGVIACASRCPEPPLASILAQARTLVICEDLSNIENLGAVFRNLACMIASPAAVLLAGSCCNPLNRRSLRVSMGHALRIPFATVEQWPAAIDVVHQAGFATYAMTPRAQATDLREVRRGEKVAIILGAEGPGLKDQTIDAATHRIRIPMSPGSDSLNVATALAVALWQLA